MVKFRSWVFAVAVVVGTAVGSQAPPRTDLSKTCKALHGLPVTDESSNGMVPPDAQTLLKDLKAGLRELVSSIVKTVHLGPDTSRLVREHLVSALKERGVVVGAAPNLEKELGYGYVAELVTVTPTRQPELLAVTVSLLIPCGTDTSLYLFRHADGRWNMILAEEATAYSDISGAQNQFKFQVSPPSGDGSFTVLSATVPAWCSSVWHPLQYRVRRVTSGHAQPDLLLSAEVGLIAQDEGYELKTTPDGFALVYSVLSDDNDRVRETLKLTLLNGKVSSRRSRAATQ
jgi:hypothetical protein